VTDTEERIDIEFDGVKINYKKELIDLAKSMLDPFNNEFDGDMNYEQNPADPQHPTKTVIVTPFVPGWQ
jgi:hypothetical protein